MLMASKGVSVKVRVVMFLLGLIFLALKLDDLMMHEVQSSRQQAAQRMLMIRFIMAFVICLNFILLFSPWQSRCSFGLTKTSVVFY
jgi:hypothetical protein